jgi:uncharacterized protein YraI
MKTTSALIRRGAEGLPRLVRSCTTLLALGALFLLALPAAPALAQSAFTVADLNMRTGPSTQYPVIVVVRRGSPVQLHSCTQGSTWCHVTHRGATGWVSGRYLEFGRPVAPRRGGIFPFISHERDFDAPRFHDARGVRGYRDYREPAHRSARGNDWHYATPPRHGGFPPRSSVRTHSVPPPVSHDYDVALRRDDVTRDYREPQYRTDQLALEAAPRIEPAPSGQTAPPRRTSRLGTADMAEPTILERRRD